MMWLLKLLHGVFLQQFASSVLSFAHGGQIVCRVIEVVVVVVVVAEQQVPSTGGQVER